MLKMIKRRIGHLVLALIVSGACTFSVVMGFLAIGRLNEDTIGYCGGVFWYVLILFFVLIEPIERTGKCTG
ncbi:hypothetical protein LCGC14_2433670 [marine sediment metagenome]|uniref:Uncharacterized protein n=1 Tax=marine sediment metagenome TaxID=412755 RepID=A0A0F9BL90_9ZZZZ